MFHQEILKTILIIFWILISMFIFSLIIKQFVTKPKYVSSPELVFAQNVEPKPEIKEIEILKKASVSYGAGLGEDAVKQVSDVQQTELISKQVLSRDESYDRDYPKPLDNQNYCVSNGLNKQVVVENLDDVVDKVNKMRQDDYTDPLGRSIQEIYDDITCNPAKEKVTGKCVVPPYVDALSNDPIYFNKANERVINKDMWEYNEEDPEGGGDFRGITAYDPMGDMHPVLGKFRIN